MAELSARRVVVIAAVAGALGLAGCGGPNPSHVASLGPSGTRGGASTTTLPTGNATQLLDEWAACVRSHGDPNQADPTVDATKVIQLTVPAGWTQGQGYLMNGQGRASCTVYMTAAQTALRGGEPPQTPNQATAEKFAQCMRANGVPDYPDPTANQGAVHATPGSDLNPSDPTFQAASTLCTNKTGFQDQKFGSGTLQPGDINLNMAGGFGGKPGGNGGPAANSGAGATNG